jgi:hypothetical protein
MPGGDGFANAAETADICGAKAGSAAMASMGDGAPVGLGMRIFWCRAATGWKNDTVIEISFEIHGDSSVERRGLH